MAQSFDDIKEHLKLDDLNDIYFRTLMERKLKSNTASKPDRIRIYNALENNEKPVINVRVAYPTAIADDSMMKQLPYIEYESLIKQEDELKTEAQKASLWYRPMQAGTGSSIERHSYLASIKNLQEKDVRIGSKGTDLFTTINYRGEKITLSLAELQILRAIEEAKRGIFKEIIFHDIVGTETAASIESIWNKQSLIDPHKTYRELVIELKEVQNFGKTFQSYLPTLTEEGHITFNRMAPGGHALFGVDALLAAYKQERRPQSQGPLVGVIGNGEDLSSMPDALMVGTILKNKIPIVMVTTEKTSIDLKGGQIALVKDNDEIYATIIEKAQAEESEQLQLFESLGLRSEDRMAFFNTNMAIFNYEVLTPYIEYLIQEIGEQEFLSIISPNLIENWKEQKDSDGIRRRYLQLEGAMGSVLLNLDQYWRKKYSKPLVHIINVGKKHRTDFFSPIKTAFDYFMQFHSDRFLLDQESLRLKNQRPGHLPEVNLSHKYYKDVENVLKSFGRCSILELDELIVKGIVLLPNFTLRGRIHIDNQVNNGETIIDLNQFHELEHQTLSDCTIIITDQKKLIIRPF